MAFFQQWHRAVLLVAATVAVIFIGSASANGGGSSCAAVTCARPANGFSECKKGKCLSFCDPGFGDCNDKLYDGCETKLNTVENCGSCGKTCKPKYYEFASCEYGKCKYFDKCATIKCATYPNSTTACSKGKCGITCNPGFANCNKKIEDGCEACLDFDVKNCGKCGNVCTSYRKYGGKPICRKGNCMN